MLTLLNCQLSNDDSDKVMSVLKDSFPNIAGLEPPGLGNCTQHMSFPRFTVHNNDKSSRFVQIVNISDHWICLTNDEDHEVYMFDSLFSPGNSGRVSVTQATSLLRRYDANRTQFNLDTRLCGY
jgi:hypothetical protein